MLFLRASSFCHYIHITLISQHWLFCHFYLFTYEKSVAYCKKKIKKSHLVERKKKTNARCMLSALLMSMLPCARWNGTYFPKGSAVFHFTLVYPFQCTLMDKNNKDVGYNLPLLFPPNMPEWSLFILPQCPFLTEVHKAVHHIGAWCLLLNVLLCSARYVNCVYARRRALRVLKRSLRCHRFPFRTTWNNLYSNQLLFRMRYVRSVRSPLSEQNNNSCQSKSVLCKALKYYSLRICIYMRWRRGVQRTYS